MKFKTTAKAINANYYRVLKTGYCAMNYLLAYQEPIAYTAGVYGWNADVYNVPGLPTTVISTGYRPFGNMDPDRNQYQMIRDADNAARAIYEDRSMTNEQKQAYINKLLTDTVIALIRFEGPAKKAKKTA